MLTELRETAARLYSRKSPKSGGSAALARRKRERTAGPFSLSGLQRPVQERQAHVHPVIDVGVVVIEFLVGVPDACRGEAL